jgi:hypothetical protein
MNEYESKREARAERYRELAAKAESESNRQFESAHERIAMIPPGQPILLGHHSQRRHERALEKHDADMRKAIEAQEKAEYYRRRAEAAASNKAIFSDDPNAAEKLEDKIKRLEERQQMMKRANALVRKGDREGLLEMGFSEEDADKLIKPTEHWRDPGFASYQLSNNNANIRRLKERLKQVQKAANEATREWPIEGGIRIVDDVEANRTRIYFPGKPAEEMRRELKSAGFRWSPTEGAWQRHRSTKALYWGLRALSVAHEQVVAMMKGAAQ